MTEPIEGFRSSPQQLRAWRLQREGAIACSLLSLHLEGDLDRRALHRSLAVTVARHEILRTAFRLPAGLTAPLQVILDPEGVFLPEVDFRALAPERRPGGLAALLDALGGAPFDLGQGEGWRAALVQLGPGDHEMLLALSAVCADPETLEPLAAELVAAYARELTGDEEEPEPPLQYVDVAQWQNNLLEGEDAEEGLAVWRQLWREHDVDARLSWPLPLQESETAPGPFAPREVAVPLACETAGALNRLAGTWGSPLQVLILAAWNAVIQRGTGRDETLVGVLRPGRGAEELRRVIGPLARYLPIAGDFSRDSSLREAAARIANALTKAEQWEDYFSWDHVAGTRPGTGGFPLCFEAGASAWKLAVHGLRVTPVRLLESRALLDGFSLALSCSGEGESLRLAVRYDTRRFRREAAHRLAGRLAALLGSVVARPEAPLSHHPAMAEDELGLWLHLSRTPQAAARLRKGTTLAAVFEDQVDLSPDRLALLSDHLLTFGELDVRANRLAHHLRAAGAGPEVPVALCLDRSVEAVVAILAIWKAGACHVPLDPAQPTERLAFLLEDTAAPLLIGHSRLAARLPGAGRRGDVRPIWLDQEASAIALRPAGRPGAGAGPGHLAYTIYTSGSTGRPKGVQVEHRSALHLLAALEVSVLDPLARSGALSGSLRASLNAPVIFDASVQQLVLLLAGHALCLVPEDLRADGAALLGFLRAKEVDLLDCTPSQLRLLVDAGLLDGPAGPRIVLTAGEALEGPLWKRLAGAQRRIFFNLYGPTEGSVDATAHRIARGSDRPTIGRPLAGYEVFLLDRLLLPAPLEAPGEICLGGPGLARGYLRRPDLTAERFVPHPCARRPGERLYRTGDLARHRPEGTLDFLGRLDHQVKLRGFRIELGEIEAALVALPGVREAAVAVREERSGGAADDRRLVAYVTGDASAEALRRSLRERLPDYMVPSTFVLLPALPLTASGKVDRKALPDPQHGEKDYLAPRTPVEEVLAGLWAEVLGLERVGAADHFFDLGGHSLLATQVMSRLRGAFVLEMPLRELFEAPRLSDLASRVEAALRAGPGRLPPPLVPVPRDLPLPLSFAQQRLWFIDQLEPGSPLYNVPIALRVDGPLDGAALALCLGEIVRRHEALHSVFAMVGGEPVQVARPAAPFELPLVDLSGLPGKERDALAARLTAEEAGRGFDLARGPLLRGMLLRLGAGGHLLALTLHHIASDGWSMGILVREVAALYAASAQDRPSPLPELPVQYADFAVWQRSWLQGEVLEQEIAWWRRQLKQLPPLLELPTDRPRPAAQSHRGAAYPVRLPAGLTRALAALARREGATLFMVLLAAFQGLLARYSGQEDLAVGTPVAGRNRVEVEDLIGFFVNTLVMRGDLSGSPSFRTLLGRVRETALAAYVHQDVPFERLVEELAPQRSLAHAPLFQVMLVLQNAPAESLEVQGLRLGPVEVAGTTAKFDLTVTLSEHDGGLIGTVEHATDLFDRTTVDRLTARFERLLTGLAEEPERHVEELDLLTAGEAQQLAAWNATAGEYPPVCVHALFAEQAQRTPDAVAVAFGGRELTYGALDRRSRHLARRLRRLGVGPGSPVGLCAERSAEMVAGMLGILAAGGAYMPLDPGYPEERLAFMLEDTGALALVTQEHLAGRLPGRQGLHVEFLEVDGASPDVPEPASVSSPGDPACVIYTSGSTGRPKGVIVPHRAIVRLVRGTDYVRLGPEDRVAQAANSSFDAATFEVWGALLNGGRLVGIERSATLSPTAMVAALERGGVSALFLTTALFNQVAREEPGGFARLKHLLFGGELVDPAVVAGVLRDGPPGNLLHVYGPTETTTFASWHRVESVAPGATVPIGQPLANGTLHVLDRGFHPLPAGIPGELFVGGDGLAQGYHARPELTAERFVPDLLASAPGGRLYRTGDLVRRRTDGAIEFLGRLDQQVKIRGFRVEPGEVEAVLAALPGVRETAVVAREDAPGDRRLVAYVAGDAEADGLRRSLREKLPDYMVPAVVVVLPELPLTPNGKVDRKALPAPARHGGEAWVAPRTPVEEVLAGLWAEVLGRERVGASDHFFDLGGHSLLATRVVSRLRAVFGVELALRELFEAPRLSELALRIEAALRSGAAGPAPPPAKAARELPPPLSFAQQRLWFIDQLQPGSPLYNMSVGLRIEGPLDGAALERCLGEIVRRHEALRTVFAESAGSPAQVIRPAAPFALPVVDLSGLPERRRETAASDLAGEEAGRPFDLTCHLMLRGLLLRLAGAGHALALTLHHIASDGWSLGILVREVAALYPAFAAGRPSPLPELPLQYADFAVWQRSWLQGTILEQEIAWWRRQLAGLPPLLELPTDRPRPAVQSYRGASRPVRLPARLARGLEALARREGATLFMVLLAGFEVLLSRHSGQDKLAVGTPIAGRNRAEIEGLIGFFVNTLVLGGDLSGEPSFRELLGRVRETALAAYMHQDVPFERLVEEMAPERSLAHAPLFQVMLALQNVPAESLEIRGLQMRPVNVGGMGSRFDLALGMEARDDGLPGTIEYSTDLFDATTVDRMAGCFERLLAAAVAAPGVPFSVLPLLNEIEAAQVLVEWNDTQTPVREGLCLHSLLGPWTRQRPDAIAAVCGEGCLTHGELERRAAILAARLRTAGVSPEKLVGICLDEKLERLTAVLGVLLAGGAYLPLDPGHPRERLASMIDDAGVDIVLTSEGLAGVLPETVEAMFPDRACAAGDGGAGSVDATPENLAYVIYTSGSTGRPNGVMVNHRSAVRLVFHALRAAGLGPSSRVLHAASFSFDASVLEIWAALASGGTLYVAPREARLSGGTLGDLARRVQITSALGTPSVLALLPTDLPSLDSFLVGGELCPAELANRWAPPASGLRRLFHCYGPTEATIYTAGVGLQGIYRREPPIGRPVDNARAYVLDRHGAPLPVGVGGELHIAGHGLARGYLNRPSLTAERFVPDPFGDAGARLYRTGDLARWLPEGNLEFLGRIDHQVKLRGLRIELGEIEAGLAALPGIREAVVVLREDAPGDRRLVAYLVGEAPTETLRPALLEKLPAYMVPATFVHLAALPLTPHGKVDRRALPAPGPADPGESSRVPKTPAEELLAALWAEVLGLERVAAHDDFFALGGHSLLATQVVSRLRSVFNVEIPLRELFEAPRLSELALRVEAALRSGAVEPASPLARTARELPLPLSFAQRRLWFFDQLRPGSPLYNLPVALRIEGPLEGAVLERCLGEIACRHEALRTVFAAPEGEPVQVIRPAAPFALPLVDLAGLPALPDRSDPSDPSDAKARQARALLAAEAARPFDLARDLMLRGVLLRLGEDDHVLALTLHHVASDGWSMGILVREVAALYPAFAARRPSPLPELPLQYADFAVWQRSWLQGDALEQRLGFWRAQLAGLPPLLELPTDRPRPAVQSYRGASQPVHLPAGLTRRLEALARREGATLFMVLLAGFEVLLARHSGQDDLAVGTPIAGRNRPEIEGLIGFFVNTLVLRGDLSGEPTFGELLGRVRETALAAYMHQDVPFERLVEEMAPERSLAHPPLFQVMLALQNVPLESLEIRDLRLRPVALDTAAAKFDLTLTLGELDGGLAGTVGSAADLLDGTTVGRLVDHLERLLAAAVEAPMACVFDLPLLSAAERRLLLGEWSASGWEPPARVRIDELFARQVARTPGKIAVVCQGKNLTYQELDERAGRLAHRLCRDHGNRGDRGLAGLMTTPDLPLPVGMLGILKAGGGFVPLDPGLPAGRLERMATECRLTAIVADRRHLDRAQEIARRCPGTAVLDLDDLDPAPAPPTPANAVRGDGTAYVIFTSGSTGMPKGVPITHDNLMPLLLWSRDAFGFGEHTRVLQSLSYGFDFGVFEILTTLLFGGTLVLGGDAVRGDVEGSLREIREHGVNTLHTTPSFFRAVAAAVQEPLPLAVLHLGGEALDEELVEKAFAVTGPQCRLFNGYGPTEATVNCALHEVARAAGRPRRLAVPIGRPSAGNRLYVLDGRLQPVPIGVAGELLVGGAALSSGYLGRPDRTAGRFLPDLFAAGPGGRLYRTGDLVRWTAAGDLEFLGRTDDQVKIRGFRIEPGEIEAALRDVAGVRAAAVVAREDRLVAYVAGEARAEVLRQSLRERLPQPMVPSTFITLPALPLTPNGKVDRKALPEPERQGAASSPVAPRTPVEETLAGLWAELLGRERVGATDHFFDLGGHSLLAVRLIARIEQSLGVRLPLAVLFEAPTVERLAEAVQRRRAPDDRSPLVRLHPGGAGRPLFLVHPVGGEVFAYAELARRLGAERPVYGLRAVPAAAEEGHPALRELAAQYLAAVREVQAEGPYHLAGWSLGAVIAYEMAQQIASSGGAVGLLALLDPPPPVAEPGGLDETAVLAGFAADLLRLSGRPPAFGPEVLAGLHLEEGLDRVLELGHAEGVLPPEIDRARLRERFERFRRLLGALGGYAPQPYDGRVVLFRASASLPPEGEEAAPGWSALTRAEVHLLDADHYTLLQRPALDGLVEQLKADLQAAGGGITPPARR